MNENGIPLDVISKGRDLGAVLEAYVRFFKDAGDISRQSARDEDQVFSDSMMGAAYRLYLMGVEDGMKEGTR